MATKEKKPIMGRPVMAPKDRRTKGMLVRFKESEHKRLVKAAKAVGCKPATYLRNCFLEKLEGEES